MNGIIVTQTLGLSTYQWNNNIKSMVLLAAFPFLLIALVALFFLIVGWMSADTYGVIDPHLTTDLGLGLVGNQPMTPILMTYQGVLEYGPYVFGIAVIWVLIGTLFNEGLIRMATGAKSVSRTDAPELYNLLENLCISRGMAMPKLFIIDTPIMNAYASGLGQASFSVTVTRGILETLDKDELEAVLAHELTHIINRDVRLLVVTVLFGGMLSFFAEMAWRSMRHGRISSGNSRSKGNGAILIVAALILSVGYLISVLFRLALSRRREFLADAGSVALTKNPAALIRALQKISGHAAMPQVPSGVQAMLIENPTSFMGLFATHPPIESRIAVLRRLGGLPQAGESIIPRAG